MKRFSAAKKKLTNKTILMKNYYKAQERVPRVQQVHLPVSIMVWQGGLYHGATDILFCLAKVKFDYEKVLHHVERSPWVTQWYPFWKL